MEWENKTKMIQLGNVMNNSDGSKTDVSGSLRNDRIKEVAREIANSKTKGFTEEWEKYREEEYKYWLKRIRWAVRSNDR